MVQLSIVVVEERIWPHAFHGARDSIQYGCFLFCVALFEALIWSALGNDNQVDVFAACPLEAFGVVDVATKDEGVAVR